MERDRGRRGVQSNTGRSMEGDRRAWNSAMRYRLHRTGIPWIMLWHYGGVEGYTENIEDAQTGSSVTHGEDPKRCRVV